MRNLSLAALLLFAPALARAQSSPRSLAVELGFSNDSAAALGARSPVALVASWWLAGDLDATARASWAFASRTQDRAADDSFEAGAGLRYGLARWSSLRPQVLAELSFVQILPSALAAPASGVRFGASAALEAFLGNDVSLTLVLGASRLFLVEGSGFGLAASLRAGAYF
jgi:hypothetical protein